MVSNLVTLVLTLVVMIGISWQITLLALLRIFVVPARRMGTRLLLARPRVVILDNATAHLDSTSEAAVQTALGEALAGRTAIAHRLLSSSSSNGGW